MKERTFRFPTNSDILRYNGLNPKATLDEKTIMHMLNTGVLVWGGETYREAVEKVESIRKKPGQIVILPEKFAISQEDAREGVKSLGLMTKLDSKAVLEQISGKSAPRRLTKEFLQEQRITPAYLARIAFSLEDVENPKIGAYWAGSDDHFHAWTFGRCATAAEMMLMAKKGAFPATGIGVKTLYGNNLAKVKVQSRTAQGVTHEVSFARLPIQREGTKQRFDTWLNMSFVSTDQDFKFVADQHNKLALPVYFASTPVVYAFYGGVRFIRELGQRKLSTNPFPILANAEMVDFQDDLRLSTLVMHTDEDRTKVRPLGKTEMDRLLGARTTIRGYQSCWFHSAELGRDISYLFTPRNKK